MRRAILGAVLGAVVGVFVDLVVAESVLYSYKYSSGGSAEFVLLGQSTRNHYSLMVATCTAAMAAIGAIVGSKGAIIATIKQGRPSPTPDDGERQPKSGHVP